MYKRLAAYLNDEDRGGSAFQAFGGPLTPDNCANKIKELLAWGAAQRDQPTGAGTTDDDEVEWNRDTFVNDPVAEQCRVMYSCWYRHQRFKQAGADAAAKKEADGETIRAQATSGRQPPTPTQKPGSQPRTESPGLDSSIDDFDLNAFSTYMGAAAERMASGDGDAKELLRVQTAQAEAQKAQAQAVAAMTQTTSDIVGQLKSTIENTQKMQAEERKESQSFQEKMLETMNANMLRQQELQNEMLKQILNKDK
jgi:hypothetical protein